MVRTLKIEDVMTKSPHSIGLDQNVSIAQQMMRERGIRHLPVQDGGKLVGILTHRDVQFALGWAKEPANELEIKDVYTPDPYVVEVGTTIDQIVERMAEERIGSALVLDKGKLVGIFTTVDACRVLALLLKGDL